MVSPVAATSDPTSTSSKQVAALVVSFQEEETSIISSAITEPQHINTNTNDCTSNPYPFNVTENHVDVNANVKDKIVIATKLMGDVLVAVSVTALAAPFLAIIDKALVERTTATASSASSSQLPQANRITVWTSMYHSSVTILHYPMKFLRSPTFLWMWGTYAATYTAANTLRTLLSTTTTTTTTGSTGNNRDTTPRDDKNIKANTYTNYFLSSGTTLLIGTSLVNSTASVLKDRAYAQLYGATTKTITAGGSSSSTTSSPLRVPNITYGVWVLRDLTVIGAAFVLPHHVAQFWITQQQRYKNVHGTTANSSYIHFPQFSDATIVRVSQIGTPVLAQVIAGPLHFIGYDCYNHFQNIYTKLHSNNLGHPFRSGPNNMMPSLAPLAVTTYQFWSERLHNLRSSIGQVITARMMRIVPGYGIAGIWNTELLLQWKKCVVQPIMDHDTVWYRHQHHDDDKHLCPNDVNTAVWGNRHHPQRC